MSSDTIYSHVDWTVILFCKNGILLVCIAWLKTNISGLLVKWLVTGWIKQQPMKTIRIFCKSQREVSRKPSIDITGKHIMYRCLSIINKNF